MFRDIFKKKLSVFARLTDYSVFYIFIGVLTSCLPYFLGSLFYLILIALIPLLWIPIEALLISRYGTTPGKSLFGIRVHTQIGGKLSYLQALKWASFLPSPNSYLTEVQLGYKHKVFAYVLSLSSMLIALCGKSLAYYTMGLGPKVSVEGWIQYYSMTRGFTVHFPNNPQEESKQLTIPDSSKVLNYEEISSQQTKDVLYSVSYMELPSKWRWAGSNTLLKGALDLFVKYNPVQTEVMEKEILLYQNHRALDFHLKQGDNEVKGRFILVDNTLYKLTVIYPSSLREQVQQGGPFLNSFDLHPKGIDNVNF